MRQLFKLKRFYMFLCVIGFIVFAYKVLELRYDDVDFAKEVNDNYYGYELKANRYEAEGQTMRYLEIGCDTLPVLFLIHGSPSSASSWQDLLRDSLMLSHFYMVAVDRPGYGYSDFGKVQKSIIKQAKMVMPALKAQRGKSDKIMVVGSSYGGPVAARLGMEYPELMETVLLQSSSMQPKAEKIYAISYPTSKAPLKWLIPTVFRMANEEKLGHEEALLEMDNDWGKITDPVTIFHGDADDLIYFSNALYAQEKLVNSAKVNLVAIEGEGHGMLWSNFELVKKTMIEAIKLAN
ncbi:MAG: alpha/beta fold hydrolase [Saprospiraceae bacterium]